MKAALVILGAVLCIGAFIVFNYLVALGCAMNTTGCRGYTLDYFSGEAAALFWPPLLIGLAMIVFGLRRKR